MGGGACARAGAAGAAAPAEHFGRDPAELPIVARASSLGSAEFQVAIDGWAVDRDVEVVGLPVMQGYRAGLAELVRGAEWMSELEFGAGRT